MADYLEMKGICKSFVGIPVLKNVDLSVRKGEIHALVGENGTGKSTLMKILFGIYKADAGEIKIDGKTVQISSPKQAYGAGIRMIHQELQLIPEFTIAQNIMLGNEIMSTAISIDRKKNSSYVQKAIEQYGLALDADAKVKNLTLAEKQMVEILKALYFKSAIVVMDEPTAPLTDKETEILFSATKKMSKAGTSIIYISHRLEELPDLAERITIMRDGMVISTNNMKDVTKDEIVKQMVGRTVEQFFVKTTKPLKEIMLEVDNLCVGNQVKNVSFDIYKGEVLGLAGLMGSNRSVIAKAIYGDVKKTEGTIRLKGKKLEVKNCKEAIKNGIGYLPEDRKTEGLVLMEPVYKNVTYPRMESFCKMGIINEFERKKSVQLILKRIGFKDIYFSRILKNLSGGNQQKVIMGRWYFANCELLILNEPTRGIDVGAKKEIYEMINEMISNGKSVLLISSDMPELLNMSDRIITIKNGRISGCFEAGKNMYKQTSILQAMLGGVNCGEN